MRHEDAREQLAAGEVTSEVQGHLEDCEACAAYAGTIEEIREVAPALAEVRAPEGLADRVLAHVRTEARGAQAVIPPAVVPPSWSRRLRRPIMAAAGVAAASALVAALLTVGPGGGPTAGDVLLASARATREMDTARLELTGRAEVRVELPQITFPTPSTLDAPLPTLETPDLEGVPEELRDVFRQQFDEAREQFEAERRRFETEQARAREELAQRAELPTEIETVVSFEGSGAVVPPDRLRMDGTVTVERSTLPDVGGTEDYAIVVVADEAWMRSADGRWFAVPAPHGPFGPLMLDPEAVADFLERAEGSVEDLGTESIDGVEVRHLRYSVSRDAFGPGAPGGSFSTTAEAWIGADDGLVRKVRLVSEGSMQGPELDEELISGASSSRWRTEQTARLSDFGAPVEIDPPPADEVAGELPAPEGSSAILYPFGGHVHVSVSSGQASTARS